MANSLQGFTEWVRRTIHSNLALLILIGVHIVVCCVSLVWVSEFQTYIPFNGIRLGSAILIVMAFSTIALLFVIARFSFGYFVGFYLYTMVLGFLWIVNFTKYNYDHAAAAWSATASMLLFLLPALLVEAPLGWSFALSIRNLENLLRFLLALSLLTIAVASTYNFRFVTIQHIYDYRSALHFPTIIRYLIVIVSNAALPFMLACYLALNRRWLAGVILVLMLLFYPITLSKLALFAPAWIVALLVLSKLFEARTVTVLSLFLPVLVGVILILTVPIKFGSFAYFDKVNIRMIATPSSAIDIYNDFFSKNPHTHFCQLSFLKPLMRCPYRDELSVVMEKTYGFGNLNASLFATEGIASVGLYLAPLSALLCGLVIACANRLSAGLPPRFMLISGALLPQVLLNVPFSTAMITHGMGLLMLLWSFTPRTMFEANDPTNGAAANAPASGAS
jgi:hypothetical protein